MPSVKSYLAILDAFIEERLTAEEFENVFLRLYKLDPTRWPENIFEVLDGLFYHVDDYCDDPEVRQAVGGIDADQLREHAAHAVAHLRTLMDAQ